MKIFFKLNLLVVFFFLFFTPLNANEKLKFANMDLIIQKTNVGKAMLNKISNVDKENIDKLKSFEDELKTIENEIKLKKNIISENELDAEINELKLKINNYKQKKNSMVKNLEKIKNHELKIFFDKINPIIQSYMNDNSIEIILNGKNVIMGNKNSDLTNQLILEINNKI